MKNAPLILFFFFAISLPAQNAWDLFPLNQKTWWRAGDTLRLYYNDSTELNGDLRAHYFGSEYVVRVLDDCFYQLLGEADPWIPIFPPPDFFYTWESNNVEWKIPGNGSTIFYPKSTPGDSWIFPVSGGNGYNQIRVTCAGSDSIDFFGQQVLAKKFRLTPLLADVPVSNSLSDFEITLTENYGFTRFIPFHELIQGKTEPVYEMAGFIRNGQNFGLAPDFESFTQNYQERNLYKWHETLAYYPAGETTEWWHFDSLTAVTRTPDEIQLSSHRKTTKIYRKIANGVTTTDSSAYSTPEFKRILKRTDFQPLFSAASDWYFPAVTEHYGNMTYVTSHFDTTGALQLSGDFNYFFEPCDLREILDASYSVAFDNRCGYLGYQEGFFSGYENEILVGCRHGAETWGDITPPPTVGVLQPQPVFSARVYPSLTTGIIYIEDLPEPQFAGELRLEIRHIDGRLGLENSHYQHGQPVDTSSLPGGAYLLVVRSKNAAATGKFIKM